MTRPASSRVRAVVLAQGRGEGLQELAAREAHAALFVGGRRRLVDYALLEVARAGLPGATVLVGRQPATFLGHLPQAWGSRVALEVASAEDGTLAADLRRGAGEVGGEVALLPGTFDLLALLAADQAGAPP